MKKKIIIAITGATGAVYGTRLLEILQTLEDVESHLILSSAGALTAQYELGMDKQSITLGQHCPAVLLLPTAW